MRKNLIKMRGKNGLTQLQVADRVNIGIRQYQSLEAGTSEGSMKVWKKLKQLFNENIDYLLEQVGEEKKNNSSKE